LGLLGNSEIKNSHLEIREVVKNSSSGKEMETDVLVTAYGRDRILTA